MILVPVVYSDEVTHPFSNTHDGDAGTDLRAIESVTVPPQTIVRVSTGVKLAIPDLHFGMVVPRSGAASKGLGVANSPGIIDSGYRGPVDVLVYNMLADEPIEVEAGDRIAQIVFVPYEAPDFHVVDSLPATDRGEQGFGSTGVG